MSGLSLPPVAGEWRGFPPSDAPLEAVRVAWEWVCARPHPVSVDGAAVAGLPDRPVPLDELRARLLGRGCPAATRDAVWAYLVRRARTDGGTWTVAAAGMALPVLVRVARILTARFAGDPSDIHAAVVAGFLHGLTRVDPDRPAVLVSLRWAAYRGGLAAVRDALRAPVPVAHRTYESAPPHPPAGHPDLVLARAVADGAITADEAALIGSTRLEHVRLADAAAARGQTYTAANAARYRAERRLLAYLTTPDHDPEPAPTRTRTRGRAHPPATTATTREQLSGARRRRARNDARRRTRNVSTRAAPSSSAQSRAFRGYCDQPASAVDSRGSIDPQPKTNGHGDAVPKREVVRGRRRSRSPKPPPRRLLRSSDSLSDPVGDAGVPHRRAAPPHSPTAPRTAPAGSGEARQPVGRGPADPAPAQHTSTDRPLTGRRRGDDPNRRPGRGRRAVRRAMRPGGPPATTRTTIGVRPDAEPS